MLNFTFLHQTNTIDQTDLVSKLLLEFPTDDVFTTSDIYSSFSRQHCVYMANVALRIL